MRRQCNGAKRYTEVLDLTRFVLGGRGAFHRLKKQYLRGVVEVLEERMQA